MFWQLPIKRLLFRISPPCAQPVVFFPRVFVFPTFLRFLGWVNSFLLVCNPPAFFCCFAFPARKIWLACPKPPLCSNIAVIGIFILDGSFSPHDAVLRPTDPRFCLSRPFPQKWFCCPPTFKNAPGARSSGGDLIECTPNGVYSYFLPSCVVFSSSSPFVGLPHRTASSNGPTLPCVLRPSRHRGPLGPTSSKGFFRNRDLTAQRSSCRALGGKRLPSHLATPRRSSRYLF